MSDSEQPDANDADERSAAAARRLAEWVIVAGLILGAAAACFLIYEAWSANREALEHNRRSEGADVYAFDGAGRATPSDPGAQAGAHTESS